LFGGKDKMMGMYIGLEPRVEQILESPYNTALRLYSDSKKIKVGVPLENRKLLVSMALVGERRLVEILDGEKYAGTIGGMFFISEETPKEYRPFAAIHELAEYAALKGFDIIGHAKHFQAISVELGYSKHTLSSEEFEKYLKWRKSVERTNFFQLDDNGLIDKIKDRMDEIFQSIPEYLTYRNKKLVELIEE
jgi:hypothetical protein|tara:strand:+ start:2154 stop:2729 length:576 start_codon:yes stop_codon:yes gene_type:complete